MNASVLGLAAAVLLVAMAFAWGLQRLTGSSGWIDTVWSASVGVAGLVAALTFLPSGAHGRALLVAGLIGLWSARLALHIGARTLQGGEDPRYAELARQWGADFPLKLLAFAEIQALAALPLVAAIRWAAVNPAPFPRFADFFAVLLLLTALVGEAVADAQLTRFKRAHRGEKAICAEGLWAWSRHPNYFFEWLGWCAYPLLAIDFSGAYPLGWLSLAAPALMYHLLVHVSGIPPLETYMAASRGADFDALKTRVSPFFPLPPRRNSIEK